MASCNFGHFFPNILSAFLAQDRFFANAQVFIIFTTVPTDGEMSGLVILCYRRSNYFSASIFYSHSDVTDEFVLLPTAVQRKKWLEYGRTTELRRSRH